MAPSPDRALAIGRPDATLVAALTPPLPVGPRTAATKGPPLATKGLPATVELVAARLADQIVARRTGEVFDPARE